MLNKIIGLFLIIFMFILPLSYTVVTADKEVIYLKFDDNTKDSSGNGLIDYGYYTTYENGIDKKAIYFNGERTFVTINDNDLLSFTTGIVDEPMSISCWIKSDIDTEQTIVMKGYNYNADYEYSLAINEDNKIEFTTKDYTNGGILRQTSDYELSEYESIAGWYYIFITKPGNTISSDIKIYINSILIDTTDGSTGAYTCMRNNIQQLRCGYGYDGAYWRYEGLVDEFKMYDYECDNDFINFSYNSYSTDYFSIVLIPDKGFDYNKNISVYENAIFIEEIRYGESFEIKDKHDYTFVVHEDLTDRITDIDNIDNLANENASSLLYILIIASIVSLIIYVLRR